MVHVVSLSFTVT